MNSTTRVVRFDCDVYERGMEQARKERRTFAAFVNNALEDYCRRYAEGGITNAPAAEKTN